MLVLARRRGEGVHIRDRIAITIAKIRGNQVSVSIEASKEVAIVREELLRTDQPTSGTQLFMRGPLAGPP